MIDLQVGPDRYARADTRDRAKQLVCALADTPAVPDEVYQDAKEVRDDIRELCDRMDAAEVLLEGTTRRVVELERELARRPPAPAPTPPFCSACARTPSGRCWEHEPTAVAR